MFTIVFVLLLCIAILLVTKTIGVVANLLIVGWRVWVPLLSVVLIFQSCHRG